jgi:hypothetical protein
MKLCTAVQEGCGYKDTLGARRYFAPLAKYFTVCITYQPPPHTIILTIVLQLPTVFSTVTCRTGL